MTPILVATSNLFNKIMLSALRKTGFRIARYSSVTASQKLLDTHKFFIDMFAIIEDISGSIIECGFGRGESFMSLTNLAEKNNRKIYGFDSFEGFPNPSVHDDSVRLAKKGQWNVRSLKEPSSQISGWGMARNFRQNNVHLIKGFVENSVPTFSENKDDIALLHIDLDLYQGYKIVLDRLYPNLALGGVICIDEYQEIKWPGSTKAIDEFLTLNPDLKLIKHNSGKHYLINSKSK